MEEYCRQQAVLDESRHPFKLPIWGSIASKLPGRSFQQCIQHYHIMKDFVRDDRLDGLKKGPEYNAVVKVDKVVLNDGVEDDDAGVPSFKRIMVRAFDERMQQVKLHTSGTRRQANQSKLKSRPSMAVVWSTCECESIGEHCSGACASRPTNTPIESAVDDGRQSRLTSDSLAAKAGHEYIRRKALSSKVHEDVAQSQEKTQNEATKGCMSRSQADQVENAQFSSAHDEDNPTTVTTFKKRVVTAKNGVGDSDGPDSDGVGGGESDSDGSQNIDSSSDDESDSDEFPCNDSSSEDGRDSDGFQYNDSSGEDGGDSDEDGNEETQYNDSSIPDGGRSVGDDIGGFQHDDASIENVGEDPSDRCLCGKSDTNENMVHCDLCTIWFHYRCVEFRPEDHPGKSLVTGQTLRVSILTIGRSKPALVLSRLQSR